MEEEFSLQTKDDKKIYGTINFKEKTDKAIIMVHGLTGHQNEHHFFNAVKYFTNKGFTTIRFDLYSGEDDARKLEECALQDHINDLEEVIKYATKKFKTVFLIGHSLAGPVIINADTSKITASVFWDPSLMVHDALANNATFDESRNKYIFGWGFKFFISKEMFEDWKKFDIQMIQKIKIPTKVICAGNENLFAKWQESENLISPDHEITQIKGASHCFDEEGKEEELFNQTIHWFEKY